LSNGISTLNQYLMKNRHISLGFLLVIISISRLAFAQSLENHVSQRYQINNPMSVSYLKKNLNRQTPRLVLNKRIDKELKKKLKTDPVVGAFASTLLADAKRILELPLIERVMIGRRMSTGQTRERLSTLGMAYHLYKDKTILERIDQELWAVCSFPDWNPSHFLDVAGTALGVAIAVDWAGEDLPQATAKMAKQALINKGIMPSFDDSTLIEDKASSYYNENFNWWICSIHNWNQVCHAGMIGAAIVIADEDPELAAKTIHRALDKMGLALEEYGPDGVYPEGATYWGFGTMHTIMSIAMLESAFGTDFGISDFPGFMESADFVPLVTAPSGEFFNYYDCGSNLSEVKRGIGNPEVAMFNRSSIAVNLMWFAAKTGNSFYFDPSYFTDQSENRRRQYFDGSALVWLTQFSHSNEIKPPLAWKGEGRNHLALFRSSTTSPEMYYLGTKGGKATNNHGNMDAGSFVFELNGIRWGIDLGNQSYQELEKTGFDLWNRCQDCERWTLLTKNNFGHSTLTVNDQLHKNDGVANIIDFQDGEQSFVTYDMSAVLDGQVKSANRTFTKDTPKSVIVEDEVVLSENTSVLTWQMITVADVEITKEGALLTQDGKSLKVENLSHPDFTISVISLNPSTLYLDTQKEGLKRLEIRIPAWTVEGGNCNIKVRLSGE
jgi:hypothetical protein